jgi:hypothetical protein
VTAFSAGDGAKAADFAEGSKEWMNVATKKQLAKFLTANGSEEWRNKSKLGNKSVNVITKGFKKDALLALAAELAAEPSNTKDGKTFPSPSKVAAKAKVAAAAPAKTAAAAPKAPVVAAASEENKSIDDTAKADAEAKAKADADAKAKVDADAKAKQAKEEKEAKEAKEEKETKEKEAKAEAAAKAEEAAVKEESDALASAAASATTVDENPTSPLAGGAKKSSSSDAAVVVTQPSSPATDPAPTPDAKDALITSDATNVQKAQPVEEESGGGGFCPCFGSKKKSQVPAMTPKAS